MNEELDIRTWMQMYADIYERAGAHEIVALYLISNQMLRIEKRLAAICNAIRPPV